ncbi:MAG TPA: NAD-dependent epimerase/dehydratase family protein [Chloroflexota bacterium]|nr:NAD-dependent epimerase/dehydratase family protein [Chloroflexota bacterium]
MRILILGGTRFLGRHLVDAALARGHEVTLFTRGQTNPDLYATLERIRGDRDPQKDGGAGLAQLEGRIWDAVFDTSGYVPRVVRAAAERLAGAATHYTFVSSISVYKDFARPGIDEDYPVATLEDESVEEITGDTYGPLKALCEREVERTFPGRALNVRPGLIVGPHDPTDRFTNWPHRVAQGGEVLAPNGPDLPVQVIDARDLAAWIVTLAETRTTGTFNATGPDQPLGLGAVLDACRHVSQSDARVTWVDEAFLLERGVAYWQDVSAVLPEGDPKYAGMARVDVSKAVAAGLTFRPIEQTIRDTLDWDRSRPHDTPLKAGLTRERESELLREWHARS